MTYYVVLTAAGLPKARRRAHVSSLFTKQGSAKSFASQPGDSVVAVDIPDGREPLFIRGAKL